MKTILILFVSIILLVSCESKSGQRVAQPKAKAKILTSGNIVIVQDADVQFLKVGDTVVVQQVPGSIYLSNYYYQRDTVVRFSKDFPSYFWRVVIVEKLPIPQSR